MKLSKLSMSARTRNVMCGILAATTFASVGASSISPSFAQTSGTVPPSVETGINNAVASVKALDGLALACLVVALTPLGAMLTLRFLNMVLSRV